MSNCDAAAAPEISLAVAEIVAEITGVDDVKTAPDLRIRELGILDSLGTVSLLVALAERFGVNISPSEVEDDSFGSIRQIAALVQEKISAKNS